VGTAIDGRELLKKAPRLRPDVIVLDIMMPNVDGLEAARQLQEKLPDTKLIFLTQHEDPEYVTEALRAGASGYLLKSSDPAELHKAVPLALAGRIYITPLAAGGLAEAQVEECGGGPSKVSRLTKRQKEVLKHLAAGESMKEAAMSLKVSPATVAYHKYRIMETLGLKTNARLVQWAVKHGYVS
jgi:DNA-binding NarL/FixJ family response regulator